MLRAVLDTNVLVAALRSRKGAANAVLETLHARRFIAVASNNLCFEYADVLSRLGTIPNYLPAEISAWLDGFLGFVEFHQVHFLWRPHLPDPDDERVLDAAIAGHAEYILTWNVEDFRGSDSLGIKAVTPAAFLTILRQL